MKPAIAATLVRLFTRQESVVLDPFAGVGTIPFEAAISGRHSVAVDLSPFAFCVAAGKVTPPTTQAADEYIADLAAYLDSRVQPDEADGEAEIAEFFHPSTWREVLLARRFFLEREAGGRLAPGHWFIKACVTHILHGNRPYALSRRSHGIIPIPPKGPTIYKPLIDSLRPKVERMSLSSVPAGFRPGLVHHASALSLPCQDASIDVIITSPPFLGTTEFLRQNRVRLWFCGMNYNQQAEAKGGTDFIENHKSLEIYRQLLVEFRRVVRSNGLLVLHLGVVKHIDMAQGIAPLGVAAGFRELATAYEDTTDLESHGRTDRGSTHQHQFLFLRPV